MRLQIFSDLHLEFGVSAPASLRREDVDLVILGGDIACGTSGIEWAKAIFIDQPVIYVLGNHEFYGHHFNQLIGQARECAEGSNVTFLENESIEIGGLRILGSTLWTDFCAQGAELEANAMFEGECYLNDYRYISGAKKGPLRARQTRDRCRESRTWLEAEISISRDPVLVVTHCAPTLATQNPQYEGSLLTNSFHNAFDDLIRPPVRWWVHGHTHYNADLELNGVRVIAHQKGYPRESLEGFDWGRVYDLEIES